MASKWSNPTADDVDDFMSSVVVDRAEQDETQVANILSAVVQRIRGTIGAAGVTPLSQVESEVPPEALQHAMNLTVFALLTGTPNFSFLIKGADGTETGFGYAVRKAEEWLRAVSDGKPVSYPKDVSTDEPRSLIRYGSESDAEDLTTE